MSESTIFDRPRTKQECPPHKVKPRNSKQTFRELLTEGETKTHMIGVLRNLANTRPKGPWRDYWAFYVANQSGDTESFKPEGKTYAFKLVKALNAEYAKQQGETDSEQ